MSSDLPLGWSDARLELIADLVSGAAFPLDCQGLRGLELPFFKVGNLGDVSSGEELLISAHSIDRRMATALHATIIPASSVVFAKIGMAIRLNRRRLVAQPSCIDNNLMAAIPSAGVEPRYLLRFLETVDLMPLSQSTTVPSLRKSDLQGLHVPLPPIREQSRIVAKLETLLAAINAARERLAKLPVILKRFRQSVLAAACSGRLTERWRETQNGPTAIDPRVRIRQERTAANARD